MRGTRAARDRTLSPGREKAILYISY